ncbi:MAG TPA: response regulator transcription factor [Candidatus Dormibacteraeota bacterium]
MNETPFVKVLLVHDERLMFEGLSSLLSDFGEINVVGVATSAADAVEKVVHLAPDLVLMDTRLSDSAGTQACELIREARPDVAVLILSPESDEDLMTRAASAGAAGYLSAEVSAKELVGAIKKLADGELLVTMAALARQNYEPAADGQSNTHGELSGREREILVLLRAGLTNAQIAARLGIEPGAVRAHVRSLIEKRGVHSKAQAVESFHLNGASQPA